ncbi:hypothetical protein BJV78DRAFT_616409 [Lactifluus subvellereus]|nr:hypothetical protein BJV78DRAFT_616409 [Lactifluus subvellereus]
MSDALVSPDASSTVSHHLRVLLDVWFSFHIVGGHFLVPALLVTFLFSKARRDATLINLGATLMLSSIGSCLLLYTNEYLGPEPKKGLCIFQAAIFGASAPMWSIAALTLVLQVRSRVMMKANRWPNLMVIAPYITFIFFSATIMVLGFRKPDTVTRARRTFFCSMDSPVLSLISIGFTSTMALVACGLATAMSFQLYKFLRMVRRARRPQIRVIPLAIRLVIFMAYLFFALATSLWSIRDRHTFIRDIYTSTFCFVYSLVFGTQRDVFRVWCFWCKDVQETKTATTTCKTEDEWQTTAESSETLHCSSGVLPPGGVMAGTATVATCMDTDTSHELHPPVHPHAHATLESVPPGPTPTHYTSRSVHIVVSSTRIEV